MLLLVCRDPAFLDPAVETQGLLSIIRGRHRAFKNNIQRYRLGKVLDALHGRIDRPTPKRHCIDKFEESHEVQGGLEREHGPRTQHWILQL